MKTNIQISEINTPASLGYHFPAEFEPHAATWLSWPHNEASWPGKIDSIFPSYATFVNWIAKGEKVHINVKDEAMQSFAENHLIKADVPMDQVLFHFFPTNDAWCRDHGPAFVVNPNGSPKKAVVNWMYNAWGGKYPPFDLDNEIPVQVAKYLDLPCFYPEIIMEGGSVDFNGQGTLLTTSSCLLNPNRNPHMDKYKIEKYLFEYYGISQVLWLKDGIVGDDTDGHIDDLTRFVNEDTVVTVVEANAGDENYQPLQENLKALKKMRLLSGKQLNIVELPMPAPVIYEDTRLPASYANFYVCNHAVIVPTFRDSNDDKAVEILGACFPDRHVVGVGSLDIIWGLGSFHCLSQQGPDI